MSDTQDPGSSDIERFIPGSIIAGRYRVVELVGEGGMGEVYRARDLRLGQTVALKFIPADVAGDPQRLAGLVAEVRLARQVTHPNVCRVHDLDETDGMHFLSMEFVDGEDLASLLRRIGRLPPDKAVEIAREVCAGLAAIHERGVLHRDLKPANVMIDGRGHARITDFGLAEREGTSADPDSVVGTPIYMAPECFIPGRAATVQNDLYSVGLVMYELFTGRRPHEAATIRELIRLREAPPPKPSAVQPGIDPRVEREILHCLDPDPARRPKSALAVAAALPGGDPVAAAVAAGDTPSPDAVAAVMAGAEGLRPIAAWSCLAALLAGLALVTLVSPCTRVVPSLTLPEAPEAMAGRARELIHDLGLHVPVVDRAIGYAFDATAIDAIAVEKHAPMRWRSLDTSRPSVVTFWYRESPADLVASAPGYRVSSEDPPWRRPGAVRIELDGRGRLVRVDAPVGGATPADTTARVDVNALFRAAGLAWTDFEPIPPPSTAPAGAGDRRLEFRGHDREAPPNPIDVEIVTFEGRLVSFVQHDPGGERDAETLRDPSRRATATIQGALRPALYLAALLLGAWLARRNVRAGRGDTKRAARVASLAFALRLLVWLLSGHHTLGSLTQQLTAVLAWGVYDFVFVWISYVAVEPSVRRRWPRVLTSWMRLLDGRLDDARVGRELLIGCLVGTAISLAVAGHQAAPAWFGAPPGRPDNVGFVEDQLVSLLGVRQELGQLFLLFRSQLLVVMAFVVILVVARNTLRSSSAALAAAFVIFAPLALPRGDFPVLNWALAFLSTALLLVIMLRVGLLAAGVALVTHSALQAAPLGMAMDAWPLSRTLVVLALVAGVGVYGFVRSLGGRAAFRELIPAD
jgi:serine/threonine-protein kinase